MKGYRSIRFTTSIGKRISDAARMRNLRHEDIAERSGVSTQCIKSICMGRIKNPNTETVEKLASALGVPPEWLMWEAHDKVRIRMYDAVFQSIERRRMECSNETEESSV